MDLELQRILSDKISTVGEFDIDGNRRCFIIEDEYREKKVKGKTRIPAGTYEVKLRTTGGFHSKYEKRFPDMHIGMLELQNVPGFKYILIHCGNDHKDTDGCLLAASSWYHDDKRGYVGRSSKDAYKRFYPVVAQKLSRGGKVTITIKDIPGEVAVDDPKSELAA